MLAVQFEKFFNVFLRGKKQVAVDEKPGEDKEGQKSEEEEQTEEIREPAAAEGS